MELDRFDRQLLNLLQQDAGQTAEQMAETVPLSPSAIQRRIRRLREAGVIQRDVAIVEPDRVGRYTTFVVQVRVERERPELLAQFRKWLVQQEHVQQAFYVTGDADFVLVVTAPDTETYDALMSGMIIDNPNVSRFTTAVSLSVVKRGLHIPLQLDAPTV
ncbi:MAG TPA: Lrp/AsnC family transcriptional regulator [Burkholderiaceae bacterium]|jgi:DNA-binding Lrp family transcriptional regulator